MYDIYIELIIIIYCVKSIVNYVCVIVDYDDL